MCSRPYMDGGFAHYLYFRMIHRPRVEPSLRIYPFCFKERIIRSTDGLEIPILRQS